MSEKFDDGKYVIHLLLTNKDAREKMMPFMDERMFDLPSYKNIIKKYMGHFEQYGAVPSAQELMSQMDNDQDYEKLKEVLLYKPEVSAKFAMDKAQEWFKLAKIHSAILSIADSAEEKGADSIVPYVDEIREALSFSFDNSVGLDFCNQNTATEMFNYLHNNEKVVSTGLDSIDKIIDGGWHEKTLNLLIAPSNVGKTLCKCAFAVNAFLHNKCVLYISMEISEKEISKRFMANLFDKNLMDLKMISSDEMGKLYVDLAQKTKGRLYIKEYPTGQANVNTIRHLLKELEIKQKFVPDIIFVDYLGIMTTNRPSYGDNTNTKYKTISEELRGLAVETGLPIVSSNQTNRGGYGKAEIDLTDTADSIGQVMTADTIFMIGQTEELLAENKYMFTATKNRAGRRMAHAMVNVDFEKQRITDDTEETRIGAQVENAKQTWSKAMMKNNQKEKENVFTGIE